MTLRQLPSVETLLQASSNLIDEYGRPLVLDALRRQLDLARAKIKQGDAAPTSETLIAEAHLDLLANLTPTLRPVINATGVILHTNLGRSLLSDEAINAMVNVSQHYSTLEYDLTKGERGSRATHAERLLTQLTSTESALVVNNAACALLLTLTALAKNKEVIVSRGQLIEIGGGFRVPDVMKQSGAKLVEVGTTNRTHVRDLKDAITEKTVALLRAHHSNFKIVGFTTEPTLEQMVRAAHDAKRIVIDDLGSGAMLDTAQYGLSHEPMVQESVKANADIIIFSGDKLLGGPQAGILIGRAELIEKLKRHPLARAVRADKLTLSALAATLTHYLKDEAAKKIPVWKMIAMPLSEIESRATKWAQAWGGIVLESQSTVGGGSLPEETLKTKVAALKAASPDRFLASLRESSTPIIARIENDLVVFDPRTVSDEEESELMDVVYKTYSVLRVA